MLLATKNVWLGKVTQGGASEGENGQKSKVASGKFACLGVRARPTKQQCLQSRASPTKQQCLQSGASPSFGTRHE